MHTQENAKAQRYCPAEAAGCKPSGNPGPGAGLPHLQRGSSAGPEGPGSADSIRAAGGSPVSLREGAPGHSSARRPAGSFRYFRNAPALWAARKTACSACIPDFRAGSDSDSYPETEQAGAETPRGRGIQDTRVRLGHSPGPSRASVQTRSKQEPGHSFPSRRRLKDPQERTDCGQPAEAAGRPRALRAGRAEGCPEGRRSAGTDEQPPGRDPGRARGPSDTCVPRGRPPPVPAAVARARGRPTRLRAPGGGARGMRGRQRGGQTRRRGPAGRAGTGPHADPRPRSRPRLPRRAARGPHPPAPAPNAPRRRSTWAGAAPPPPPAGPRLTSRPRARTTTPRVPRGRFREAGASGTRPRPACPGRHLDAPPHPRPVTAP